MEKRKRKPGPSPRNPDEAFIVAEEEETEGDLGEYLDADGCGVGGGRRPRGASRESEELDLPDEPPPGYFG